MSDNAECNSGQTRRAIREGEFPRFGNVSLSYVSKKGRSVLRGTPVQAGVGLGYFFLALAVVLLIGTGLVEVYRRLERIKHARQPAVVVTETTIHVPRVGSDRC